MVFNKNCYILEDGWNEKDIDFEEENIDFEEEDS